MYHHGNGSHRNAKDGSGASGGSPGQPSRYRVPGASTRHALIALVLMALSVIGAVHGFTVGANSALLYLLGSLLFGVIIVRAIRMGVEVRRGRLLVRRLLWNRKIEFESIQVIQVGDRQLNPQSPQILLQRTDGETVVLVSSGSRPRMGKQELSAEGLVERLNSAVTSWRLEGR